MTPAGFSVRLRNKANPIWQRELEHPFVRGLGDGTLPIESFRFYLCQDYLFLIDYCRVFGLAAAKAPDLESMEMFASLLHDTLHTEMQLHRDSCARLGIARAELESTIAAPQTLAYTSHLLNVAWSGSLAAIVAAVLPCAWGYAEIGQTLARRGEPAGSPYAEWIRTYAGEEFAAGGNAMRRLLDRLAAGLPESVLAPLESHFIISSRHEYLFWEMAWTRASWPL